MRQYGCLAGNDWESNREFCAAKARAVEDREADRIIDEQLLAADTAQWEGCDYAHEIETDMWCADNGIPDGGYESVVDQMSIQRLFKVAEVARVKP